MAGRLRIWLCIAASILTTLAQTITPTNSTPVSGLNDNLISLSQFTGDNIIPILAVTNLTSKARSGIPPSGLNGKFLLTGLSEQDQLQSENIAIISCDPYSGYIQPVDLFKSALEQQVAAIVLYSEQSDYCALDGYDRHYPWIYTTQSKTSAANMPSAMLQDGTADGVIGFPSRIRAAAQSSSSNGAKGGNGHQNWWNQRHNSTIPSTAVAMVILYSITGIVTLLFLIIIVTGALRAHRHPERYGPRNLAGRARQSRAKGLARAMLETLPIVKFGDREEAKPTDVEMADSANSHAAPDVVEKRVSTSDADVPEEQRGASHVEAAEARAAPLPVEAGIAPAQSDHEANPAAPSPNTQGCSICTDDFVAGQDQRVLPCDHRFHPECIDPWLLNVSGTCPLCRIDLRPVGSREVGERDENGNVVLREGSFDPPPLGPDEDPQRRGRLFFDMLGIRRPDRLTREERVLALRQLRRERLARRRQNSQPTTSEAAAATSDSPEEERRIRRRLRDRLGIRTRRMGQSEVEEADEQPRDAAVL